VETRLTYPPISIAADLGANMVIQPIGNSACPDSEAYSTRHDYLSPSSVTSDNHRIVAMPEPGNHAPRNRFAEQIA
jgi:hypothetical protein